MRMHTAVTLRGLRDRPVVIKLVERGDCIVAARPNIDSMPNGGPITAADVEVVHYRSAS